MSKSVQEVRPRAAVTRKDEPCRFDVTTRRPASGGFFSFSYTYAELYLQGGRTRVQAARTRLHEGRLSTETFEGELDDDVFGATVRHAQQQVLAQAAWLLRPVSWPPWLLLRRRSKID